MCTVRRYIHTCTRYFKFNTTTSSSINKLMCHQTFNKKTNFFLLISATVPSNMCTHTSCTMLATYLVHIHMYDVCVHVYMKGTGGNTRSKKSVYFCVSKYMYMYVCKTQVKSEDSPRRAMDRGGLGCQNTSFHEYFSDSKCLSKGQSTLNTPTNTF